MKLSGEKPVVNQIELNPFLQQQKIAGFCNKEVIHLTGYCPLARGRRFDDPELSRISRETGKSPAQVMIRWALERRQTVIPKSSRPLRIEKNAEVFDFLMNEGQMRTLNGLDQSLRFCPNPLDMAWSMFSLMNWNHVWYIKFIKNLWVKSTSNPFRKWKRVG